jgi:Tol biopolymer transport system component
MAQPLNPETLQPAGDPFAVADQASTTNTPPQVAAAVSANGTLVYLANLRLDGQLAWYDRSGKVLGKVGAPGMLTAVSLSPDGKTAAASRLDRVKMGSSETWLRDLGRNVESRLTDSESAAAVWSPDGARIAFYDFSQRNTYLKELPGGREERLVHGSPSDWSPDGRFLLYTDVDQKNQSDIWILPDPLNKSGARKPVPFLQTPFDESQAQFSPDGHWVAYTSNESGRPEIYLRPFPAPASGSGVKWQVSSSGGMQPRWRRDGKELFYLEPATPRLRLMAMPISPGPHPIAANATPKALFEFRGLTYVASLNEFVYSASADGQRFLVGANADQDARPTLNVMVNWPALVKK